MISLSYDNNGNLTDDGTRTYAWAYNNRIASITKDITTHTYTYNHEGQTNPIDIADTTPEFSAVYNDPDAGDTATSYQIQVATVADFSLIFWDSAKTLLSTPTAEGTRTVDISYAGSPLATGTTYYWRMKLWDDSDAEGAWSAETATFSLANPPDEIFYAYNHEGQRVTKSDGTTTTVYPNRLYNTDGTKITKHIFDGEGNVIATVEIEAGVTSTYYNHPDHLTGSNVVSDEAGNLEQALDYYPYGSIRLNDQRSTFDEQRKFTGQEYDGDTNLHYYVQRYYNQDIGRFTSQDLVFRNLGIDRRTKRVLENPQLHNSYSYVGNNPLKYVDEEGEFRARGRIITSGFGSIIGIGAQYVGDLSHNIQDIKEGNMEFSVGNMLQFRSSLQEYGDASLRGIITGAITGIKADPGRIGIASAIADIGVDVVRGRPVGSDEAIESLLITTGSAIISPRFGLTNNYTEAIAGDAFRELMTTIYKNLEPDGNNQDTSSLNRDATDKSQTKPQPSSRDDDKGR